MYALRPEFGPSLPELLSGRSKGWRYALIGGYVLILVVVLWVLLLRGDPAETTVSKTAGDASFKLTYNAALTEKTPVGDERLRLEGNGGREVTVRPLRLPPYEGQADGFLPAYAASLIPEMAKKYPGFEVRREGRSSVRGIPGYQIIFQYKRNGKTSYGRRILLLDSYDRGARDGVDLLLRENRSQVVPNADAIGTAGSLKTLLQSFRFEN